MHHRFGAFDALRGVAATSVVLLHLETIGLTGPILPHAYFAVDFFFALSGFVIAYTYEDKLRGGLSVGAFVMRRLIRLYPMVLLGTGFGSLVIVMKLMSDPGRVDPVDHVLVSAVANLFLLPTPYATQASHGFLFVTDGPLWSVAFEVLVNVVWCIALPRASVRVLATIIVLCLAYLVLIALRFGTTDLGFDWPTLPGGLARVGFGFGLGVLTYRLRDSLVFARGFALKSASVLLLLGMFAVPRLGHLELVFDLICVVLVAPLTLVMGLNSADNPRLDRLLGEASYPLYAIHFPILLLTSGLHQKMPHLNLGILLLATAFALALATMLVTRLYDEPVRRVLAAAWTKREQRRQQTAPRVAALAASGR